MYIYIHMLYIYIYINLYKYYIYITILTYLKILIGIKSLNTKQWPARLSPPSVKLSSFIRDKFPPKNERVIYDCCLSLSL